MASSREICELIAQTTTGTHRRHVPREVREQIRRYAERLVEGDPSLGDGGRVSRRRRLVRALLEAIERGDARAAKPILDRIWPALATKGEPKPVIKLAVDAQDLLARSTPVSARLAKPPTRSPICAASI